MKAVYLMEKGCLSEERIHLAAFLFEKEKVMEIIASAGTVFFSQTKWGENNVCKIKEEQKQV